MVVRNPLLPLSFPPKCNYPNSFSSFFPLGFDSIIVRVVGGFLGSLGSWVMRMLVLEEMTREVGLNRVFTKIS